VIPAFILNGLISGLGFLESKPVADTAIRDTLGNAVPKMAITRSKDELIDVGTSNFGNIFSFVGGGLAVNWLLRKTFEKFQKELPKTATMGEVTAQRWAVLSRSIGIYSAMTSFMWAMPFIRNYLTTKRTGVVNYADMIKSGGAKLPDTPERRVAVAASLKESKNKALTILGVGAAGIVLPALLGRYAAQKGLAGEALKDLFKKELKLPLLKGKGRFEEIFLLGKGEFSKLGGLPSMMFWGIPAYIGWYHASRDPYEKKEVFVRCAAFIACFSLPPALAVKAFEGKFKNILPNLNNQKITFELLKTLSPNESTLKSAQKLLIGQNLVGMGSSIALLGIMPQVLNIMLTKRRMANKQQMAKPNAAMKLTESISLPTSMSPSVSPYGMPVFPGNGMDATSLTGKSNGIASGLAPNPAWAHSRSAAFSPMYAIPSIYPTGLGSRTAFR